MALHELQFAIGSITLLRNLNSALGLCDGTRLQVLGATDHLILAKLVYGRRRGTVVLIPKIKKTYKGADLPFKLCRVQFPISLGFA